MTDRTQLLTLVNRALKKQKQEPADSGWLQWGTEECPREESESLPGWAGSIAEAIAHRRRNMPPGAPTSDRRARREPQDRTMDAPGYWSGYWQREMQRFEPEQRTALAAVGRISLLQGMLREDGLVRGWRPLEDKDFVPQDEIGAFIGGFAGRCDDGETDLIEWPVPPSEEHPYGADGVLFRWGWWNKDVSERGRFGCSDLPDNPLGRIKAAAQRIADQTHLPVSEAVAFLLCNRTPAPPVMRGVTHLHQNMFNPALDRAMFTLEIRNPLLITVEEVAVFYSEWRREIYGARTAHRPWPSLLLSFVCEQRAAGLTWEAVHQSWNERYPDHPYKTSESLRRSCGNARQAPAPG